MAYLEYMLKCAGVPSGDALTELLGTFQNKPASTLEKTASYSEGIRSLGKMLHGVSGGDMYKLGKCAALCKFAAGFHINPNAPKAVQEYQKGWAAIRKPYVDAANAKELAKGNWTSSVNTLKEQQAKTPMYQQNLDNAQKKLQLMQQNPQYTAPNASPALQQELANAQADVTKHQGIFNKHTQNLNNLQQHADQMHQVYDAKATDFENAAAVPVSPEDQVKIQQMKEKMRKDLDTERMNKHIEESDAIRQQKQQGAADYNIDRTTGEYGAKLRAAVDAASPEARSLFELGMRRQGSLTEGVAGVWQGFRQGINYKYNGVPLRSNYKTDFDFLQACKDFYARDASAEAKAESKAAAKRAIKQEEQNRQDAHEEKQQQFTSSEAEKQRQHEETMGKQTADLVRAQTESGDRASESKFKSMAIGGGILGTGGLGAAIALRPTTPVMPMYGYAPQPQPMMPPQQQQQ